MEGCSLQLHLRHLNSSHTDTDVSENTSLFISLPHTLMYLYCNHIQTKGCFVLVWFFRKTNQSLSSCSKHSSVAWVRPRVFASSNYRIGFLELNEGVCLLVLGTWRTLWEKNSPLPWTTCAGRNMQSSVVQSTVSSMDTSKKNVILREGFMVKRVRDKTKAVKYRFNWVRVTWRLLSSTFIIIIQVW